MWINNKIILNRTDFNFENVKIILDKNYMLTRCRQFSLCSKEQIKNSNKFYILAFGGICSCFGSVNCNKRRFTWDHYKIWLWPFCMNCNPPYHPLLLSIFYWLLLTGARLCFLPCLWIDFIILTVWNWSILSCFIWYIFLGIRLLLL